MCQIWAGKKNAGHWCVFIHRLTCTGVSVKMGTHSQVSEWERKNVLIPLLHPQTIRIFFPSIKMAQQF